jgi:hypothetical protein
MAHLALSILDGPDFGWRMKHRSSERSNHDLSILDSPDQSI